MPFRKLHWVFCWFSVLLAAPLVAGQWVRIQPRAADCRGAGLFAYKSDGGVDLTHVRYLSKQVRLAEREPFRIAHFVEQEKDILFLSLHITVEPCPNAERCASFSFPDSSVDVFKPASIRLEFFSPRGGISTEVQGTESFNLFGQSQWIHVMIQGSGIMQDLTEGKSLIDHVFSGVLHWTLDDGRKIRQPFEVDDADEKRIIHTLLGRH